MFVVKPLITLASVKSFSTTLEVDSTTSNPNWWSGKNMQQSEFFLDFNCQVNITVVHLRNAYGGSAGKNR